jgi:hypothetical protein
VGAAHLDGGDAEVVAHNPRLHCKGTRTKKCVSHASKRARH